MNPYAMNPSAQPLLTAADHRAMLQQAHTNSFVSEELHNAMHAANLGAQSGSQQAMGNSHSGLNKFMPNGQLSQLQFANLLQQQMAGLQLNGGVNVNAAGRLMQVPQMNSLQDVYGAHNAQQHMQHPSMAPRLPPTYPAGLQSMDAALLSQMMAGSHMLPPSLNAQHLNAMASMQAQGLLQPGGSGLGRQGFTPETLAYSSQLYGAPPPRGPPVGTMANSEAQLAMALANLPPARLAELQHVIMQQQQQAQAQAVMQQLEAHSQLVSAAAASNANMQSMRNMHMQGPRGPPPSMLHAMAPNGHADTNGGQDTHQQDMPGGDNQPPHLVTSMATALLNGQLSPRAVLSNRQSPAAAGQQQQTQQQVPNGTPAEMELIQSVFQGMNLQDSSEAARQLGHAKGSADALDALAGLSLGQQQHPAMQAMRRPGMNGQMRPHPAPQLTVGRMPGAFDSQPQHRGRMSLDLGVLPSAQHSINRSSLDVPMYQYGGGPRRSSLDIATLPGSNSVGSGRVSLDMGMGSRMQSHQQPLGGRLSMDLGGSMPGSHNSSGRVSLDLGSMPMQQQMHGGMAGMNMSMNMNHHAGHMDMGSNGMHPGMDPGIFSERPPLQMDASLARRRSIDMQQSQAAVRAAAGMMQQQEAMLARTASAPPTSDFASLALGGGGGSGGAGGGGGRMGGGPASFQLPGMPPPAGMAASTKEEYKRSMLVQIGEQMARSNISVEQAISAGLLGGMCAADVHVLCTAHGAEVSRMQPAAAAAEQPPSPLADGPEGQAGSSPTQQQQQDHDEGAEECGTRGDEDCEQLLQSDVEAERRPPAAVAAVPAAAVPASGGAWSSDAEMPNWGSGAVRDDVMEGVHPTALLAFPAVGTGEGAGVRGQDREQQPAGDADAAGTA